IDRYNDQWDCKALSSNTSLSWHVGLLEKYKDQWHWDVLSSNPYIPWTFHLLGKYKKQWHFDLLAKNSAALLFTPFIDRLYVKEPSVIYKPETMSNYVIENKDI